MKKLRTFGIVTFSLLILLSGCTEQLEYVDGKVILVDSTLKADSTIVEWLQPFADSINKALNDTVTLLKATYCKDDSLGHLIIRQFEQAVLPLLSDSPALIVQNKGGIRVSCLNAGPLLLKDLYKIMPFENMVVMQCLPQSTFDSLINLIQSRGWYAKVYYRKCDSCCLVVLSDYLATGGDDLPFLKRFDFVPLQNLLLRDAFRKGFEIPD